MAHLIDNEFARYSLTEEEEHQGALLTLNQQHVIQNLIADAAEEKLALPIDPNNTSEFIQQESFLKGQIKVLTYMLAQNENAIDEIRAIAEGEAVKN